MTMTSYAQNREDVLLDRLFPRGLKGFYIDIGANDPTENSVTKHFYDLGWHGINIEPATVPFERLQEARPRDVNLNIGISDHEGTLTFHEFPPGISGVSTFSGQQADWHRERGHDSQPRVVPVTTLAKICAEHVDGDIDFLTVDVEGHEREVLEGADWTRWRPRVVVIEATEPATTTPTHDRWEAILLDADYLYAAFDGLNRYYVRREDSHLAAGLATPVNVTDRFVPYEHAKPYEELRWAYSTLERQLAAARAANETLTAENAGLLALSQQLEALGAKYERLERGLTANRAHYEAVRLQILHSRTAYDELRQQYAALEEQLTVAKDAFADVSPTALGVARRLTRASTRFPKAGAPVARSLRLVGAVSRRLQRRR
ncbi:MAG: FkbM family methyltransferase [Actinomycetota bacterium]|nr:FkbM family methyltransferase [Actinomycetota bacterium]